MLIKEYRIPLPMSVEEYRIAQLYMIQKKSRLESTGEGSGVEILENLPYRNKDGERGQYTKKIYHIGNHLPGWLKAILPKSALRVEEEAWNSYPYTKMRTTCPFVEKFYVDVETYYLSDAGQSENVFNLSPTELSNREVDLIDPIIEEVLPGDYLEEEDPLIYKSKKTSRGPMPHNWLDLYQTDNPPSSVMCAYKLIKVEFKYWGMQNKIEHFIHCGLRRPMLMGHRQAWVWQDEWYGLTIEDIRKLEEETKAILSQTMGKQSDSIQLGNLSDRESDQEGGFANTESRGSVVHVPPLNFGNIEVKRGSINNEKNGSKLELISKYSLEESDGNVPCPPVEINVERHELEREETPLVFQEREQEFPSISTMRDSFPRTMRPLSFRDSKRGSVTSYESASTSLPPCVSRRMSRADVMKGWQMTSIETPDSASEDEFFDAQEELDSPTENEPMGSNLLTIQNVELSNSFKSLELDSDSSRGSRESLDSVGSSIIDQARVPPYIHKERLCKKYSDTSTCSITRCKITTLLLVVHGGSQLDSGQDSQSKMMDLELLKDSFQTVIKTHYRGAVGRIAIRLVECRSVCTKALNILSQLCPYVDSDSDTGSCSSGFCPISSSFPISAVPLMVTSSPAYDEVVASMVNATNLVYQEFLRSDEGQGFAGEISILGDCMGALLVYDALTNPISYRGRTQSVTSNSSLHMHQSTANSSCSSLNGESGPSSPKIEKPRRTSSHVPPNKNNLAASKSLRMCLSSGNLRENVEDESNEETNIEGKRSMSPSEVSIGLKESMTNKNSYDGLSLSLDSIDQMTFDFEVSKFFAFGSPIGLVIGSRRFIQGDDYKVLPLRPACSQFYNLFHPFDPSASRIEPLVMSQFAQVPSVNVPRYHHFPLGDGQSHFLKNTIAAFPEIFLTQKTSPRLSPLGNSARPGITRHDSNMSTTSISSLDSFYDIEPGYSWWGHKRLDYALYCPEGLQQFPTAVLSPLFHVSYWESSDVAAFVVRQILHGEWDISSVSSPSKRGMTFSPSQPREKWLRRRTAIKIKNLNSNHRANDIVVMEGSPQVLSARFMYGPLDMVSLSGEKVDIYVMVQPPSGEYVLLDTVVTASGGRLTYTIQDTNKLPVGIFPLKMVVRGDHTWVDSNLAVLPPKTESVVFSIDGSFTASVSIRGKDPKVRAGAVDVVRHWQELGYLIIYVTSRPDFQKHKVMSWLAEHNFPYGLVAFGDGITKEIQRHKTEFLRKIINEAQVIVHAAYGSVKDISVYTYMGLKPPQIFCVAKHHVRKYEKQAQFLKEGYAVHLNDMTANTISRPAVGNSRLILRRGCFGLPTRPSKSRHKQLKRTSSDKQRNKGQTLEVQGTEGPAISGTFNYSSFRQTKGLSLNKIPK